MFSTILASFHSTSQQELSSVQTAQTLDMCRVHYPLSTFLWTWHSSSACRLSLAAASSLLTLLLLLSCQFPAVSYISHPPQKWQVSLFLGYLFWPPCPIAVLSFHHRTNLLLLQFLTSEPLCHICWWRYVFRACSQRQWPSFGMIQAKRQVWTSLAFSLGLSLWGLPESQRFLVATFKMLVYRSSILPQFVPICKQFSDNYWIFSFSQLVVVFKLDSCRHSISLVLVAIVQGSRSTGFLQ